MAIAVPFFGSGSLLFALRLCHCGAIRYALRTVSLHAYSGYEQQHSGQVRQHLLWRIIYVVKMTAAVAPLSHIALSFDSEPK